jgi:hypothetical protein
VTDIGSDASASVDRVGQLPLRVSTAAAAAVASDVIGARVETQSDVSVGTKRKLHTIDEAAAAEEDAAAEDVADDVELDEFAMDESMTEEAADEAVEQLAESITAEDEIDSKDDTGMEEKEFAVETNTLAAEAEYEQVSQSAAAACAIPLIQLSSSYAELDFSSACFCTLPSVVWCLPQSVLECAVNFACDVSGNVGFNLGLRETERIIQTLKEKKAATAAAATAASLSSASSHSGDARSACVGLSSPSGSSSSVSSPSLAELQRAPALLQPKKKSITSGEMTPPTSKNAAAEEKKACSGQSE